jgi:hypothetical protein
MTIRRPCNGVCNEKIKNKKINKLKKMSHLDVAVTDLAIGAVDHYTHQIDDAGDTRKHHRHENALGKKLKKLKSRASKTSPS